MSMVCLQVGQCGNQIGGQFYSTLIEDSLCQSCGISSKENEDFREAVLERFFFRPELGIGAENECPKALSVMVDMESKAISQTLIQAKKSGKWCYPDKQQFCQKRGSGNNWAHGYCVHGPKAQEDIMKMVRREVEKCDHFQGFLTLMSLAGGTGSGVGTYLTQRLREEYPHCFIMNQAVWPYNTGEVIVQNYNAVLTLSRLYQSSDAILLMFNDKLQAICSRLMNMTKISFQDINKVIAHQLASLFQPASQVDRYAPSKSRTNHMGEILEHLVPQTEYKLLSVRNIPQMSEKSLVYSTYQWPGLLKHLRQMLIADAAMEEGIDWQVRLTTGQRFNRTVANLLVLRGKDVHTADTSAFQDPKLYPSWLPDGYGLSQWTSPRYFNQYEKCAALISNCQTPVAPLNSVLEKAWSMFAARAYVHQYLQHGLAEEDFLDSFACLEQVVKTYSEI